MNSFITRGQHQSRTMLREQFLTELLTLLGDTRVLFAPKPTDTTTSVDESLTGRVLTHDATIAGRLAPLGLGYYTTFNGSSQYATTPDTANLSFGTGSWSMLALVNVTNSVSARAIASKYDFGVAQEYLLRVEADATLKMYVSDNTAGVTATRTSNAAITQGSWRLLGVTYDSGAGSGATYANGITLYQDAAVIASTAVNDGTFVQPRDTAAGFGLGEHNATPASFFLGSIALVAVCQKALSASEHWAIKRLVNAYYALSL